MYRVLTSTEALPELEQLLLRRTALGLDHRDEMWEGVLHMVPPAGGPHQILATRLATVLFAAAELSGLVMANEAGFFDPTRPDQRWRVPDLVAARPEHWTERGVEGPAALVIEVRSPGDESFAKLPFYAEMAVAQVLIIEPRDLTFVLHRLDGDRYTVVGDGRLDALDVHLARQVDDRGPKLVVTSPDDHREIRAWAAPSPGAR